jgi:hypothetical protein
MSGWRHQVVVAWANRTRGVVAAVRRGPAQTIGCVVLAGYCLYVLQLRMQISFAPWVAETDWKQWVWMYHRYALEGAFPAGHVLTDYAMIVQPPAFWAAMASLSTLFGPVLAANLLNIVAFAGALASIAWAVAQRSAPIVGAAAAALLARDEVFHKITCGGYPRSFGPTLTLLFLAAWLTGRHRFVLAVLVFQAALYPSVAVPCGLAYGIWSGLSFLSDQMGGRQGWLRRNLELLGTGLLVGLLGQLQSLRSPSWYGPVVSYAEALEMPALTAAGRTPWVPLGPFWPKVWSYVIQPFGRMGELIVDLGVSPRSFAQSALALLALLAIPALVKRRLSPQPFMLLATSILSYFLARELAFRLYLPHRMVQHTVPYVMMALSGVVVFAGVHAVLTWRGESPRKRTVAVWLAAALTVLPAMLVTGDGIAPGSLRSYARDQKLYRWIDQHTPVSAQFAGNLQPLDEIPFFARRQVYVNWKMAHPFRKGFFAEIERRMVEMYRAYYATDLDTLLTFCDREKIDFFIVDRTRFDAVERGDGQLFEPIRHQVIDVFEQSKRTGTFVLHPPPAEAVVFSHRVYDVIDVNKLRTLQRPSP